jgi:hypothetical protein
MHCSQRIRKLRTPQVSIKKGYATCIIGFLQETPAQRHPLPSSVSPPFLVIGRYADSTRTWLVSRGVSGVSSVGQRDTLSAGSVVLNSLVRRRLI